jgi:hypothetical protein
MRAGGVVPLGDQVIALEFPGRRHEGVQIMRDHGAGLTGLSRIFTEWDHRIAISRHPDNPKKTLYREQLRYSAGPFTAAVWPGLWSLWQWRSARLKALAPSWSYRLGEPGAEPSGATAGEPAGEPGIEPTGAVDPQQ